MTSKSKVYLAHAAPQDLTHTVPSNTEKNATACLLKNVSGFLQPCEMTALARLHLTAPHAAVFPSALRPRSARAFLFPRGPRPVPHPTTPPAPPDGPVRQRQDHPARHPLRPQDHRHHGGGHQLLRLHPLPRLPPPLHRARPLPFHAACLPRTSLRAVSPRLWAGLPPLFLHRYQSPA